MEVVTPRLRTRVAKDVARGAATGLVTYATSLQIGDLPAETIAIATAVAATELSRRSRRSEGASCHLVKSLDVELELTSSRTIATYKDCRRILITKPTSELHLGWAKWAGHVKPTFTRMGDGYELRVTEHEDKLRISALIDKPMSEGSEIVIGYSAVMFEPGGVSQPFIAHDSSTQPWTRRPEISLAMSWDGTSRISRRELRATAFRSREAFINDDSESLDDRRFRDIDWKAGNTTASWRVRPRRGEYFRMGVV
jgi:hypothetical protein